MLLSIIIVNYNVKYFLEQCLCSVEKAVQAAGMILRPGSSAQSAEAAFGGTPAGVAQATPQAEIFVVDNHSSDGSAQWLPGRFPGVQFILNEENKGFAIANNQALAKAKGKYILFLNPDTILPEDGLSICLSFMEANPRAGAAGLRMIDGSGHFLKESSRGFPSPWVAFCKLTGLTALFPRSAFFAKYYLGHIPSTKDHPSPVLSGACMFVRKQALDTTGGFDERFFLYAEDIDLSCRIEQAGYGNYYIAGTTILHFKGESTQKDTRYVRLFYKAMSQFRRKHFRGGGSMLFNSLLESAIWLRGGIAVIGNQFRRGSGNASTSSQAGIGSQAHIGSRGRTDTRARIGIGDKANTGSPLSKDLSVIYKTWVCGDERQAGLLRALLSRHGRAPASGPETADEIIFCEGPDFSFAAIIASLEKGFPESHRPGKAPMVKIHAAGTATAVGSPSKNERGEAILLGGAILL